MNTFLRRSLLSFCTRVLYGVCLVAAAATTCTGQLNAEEISDQARESRMQWWRDARFGMFVHWGLYSGLAGEWDGKSLGSSGNMEWIQQRAKVDTDTYAQKAIPLFKPKPGFAAEWARLAKTAGCKYLVFTTKHHEGFALHDSKVSDFDAGSVLHRDLVKEIVEACRAEGLRIGFYHSVIDWHHDQFAYADSKRIPHPLRDRPYLNGSRDHTKYIKFLHQQADELVSNYGPIDIVWWDYSVPDFQGEKAWNAFELMELVRPKQPSVLMNNRLFRIPESGSNWSYTDNGKPDALFNTKYGDFVTPEQHVPDTGIPGIDWETCMTMNSTWGYSKHDHNWKSSETILRTMIDAVSKGGNFLLNIGPKADGEIPQQSVDSLREIGAWMRVNGESLYGTIASPVDRPDWGRITMKRDDKDKSVYLHVFDWPQDGRLVVKALPGNRSMATLLSSGRILDCSSQNSTLVVDVSSVEPEPLATVVKLQYAGESFASGEDLTGKHLFILSGQSNMVGLNPAESFAPAVVAAFGRENVTIVKDAVGGKPIQSWYKEWKPANGKKPQTAGNLYDRLMKKVNKAIDGQHFDTVTFVWMQGESDTLDRGEVYAQSLRGVMQQLSEDLKRDDINLVVGRISDHDIDNATRPHWTMVREAQVGVAEEYPRGAWVDTDDLNDGKNRKGQQIKNDMHYSVGGYKELGKRFAERAIELIERQEVKSFVKWQASPEPVYQEPDYDFVKDPSVFRDNHGTYHMYYTGSAYGFQGKSPPPWRIDHATSPDGLSWTKSGTAFSADRENWEQGRVQAPSKPIWHNDKYYLFYAGGPRTPENICRIGYATSTDLKSWVKHSDYVVSHLNAGRNKANDPFVFKEGDVYYLFYTTYPRKRHEEVYYRTSTDLVQWSDPVATGAWGEGVVVWKHLGNYYMLAAVGSSSNGEVYKSFSGTSLNDFEERGTLNMNVPSFATSSWGHGDIFLQDNVLQLYFQGTGDGGQSFQIGIARPQ